MAHILIDKDNRCTCDQASKCVIMHKSGSMARCTKQELLDADYQTIQVKAHKNWFKKGLFNLFFSKEPYNYK